MSEDERFLGQVRCLYRGENGNGCAVGCMLPDTLCPTSGAIFTHMMSSSSPHGEMRTWFQYTNPDLLAELQNWHDRASIAS